MTYIAYNTDVTPREEIARGASYREALYHAVSLLDLDGYESVDEAVDDLIANDAVAEQGIVIEEFSSERRYVQVQDGFSWIVFHSFDDIPTIYHGEKYMAHGATDSRHPDQTGRLNFSNRDDFAEDNG